MSSRIAALCAAAFLSACGVNEATTGAAADDSIASSDALSSSVPIGSVLKTTGNLNLRSGAGTSHSIVDVAPKGSLVTTINQESPTSGFYNVTWNGETGWMSGSYLSFVSSPDPGTGGGDSGSGGGMSSSGGGDPGTGGGGATVDCGSLSSNYTCTADGSAMERCDGSSVDTQTCSNGCLRESSSDAQCLGGTWPLSCSGSYGTTRSTRGDYYLTAFGCWKDAAGSIHTDSGDNCIPTCLSQARASGLCLPGDTGPQCEERVTWYTADGARFGCLARVKITANGKSVVAVALDYGPSCSVERNVNFPVLDASGRINRYLFGADEGSVDRAMVHVVEVDKSTPLGPQ